MDRRRSRRIAKSSARKTPDRFAVVPPADPVTVPELPPRPGVFCGFRTVVIENIEDENRPHVQDTQCCTTLTLDAQPRVSLAEFERRGFVDAAGCRPGMYWYLTYYMSADTSKLFWGRFGSTEGDIFYDKQADPEIFVVTRGEFADRGEDWVRRRLEERLVRKIPHWTQIPNRDGLESRARPGVLSPLLIGNMFLSTENQVKLISAATNGTATFSSQTVDLAIKAGDTRANVKGRDCAIM